MSSPMASTNSAVATGTGYDEAEMRRRKVSSHEKANGSIVYSLDAEDTKKLQKKVQLVFRAFLIVC
jgi:predicted oxidoreductase (fatty acid repression mutant protein)